LEGRRQKESEDNAGSSEKSAFAVSAPAVTLPKGGGAIRGIGEKFAANPVTGTGSMTVPIFTSPGRSGFGPQLSLSYDSGSGNGPFGFGWSLALPSITRKTEKGLPQYFDDEESDTFILSGAEDLVPQLILNGGQWVRDSSPRNNVFKKQSYLIHRYRPRVEGLFARIERWVNLSDPTDTFWRSISRENITTWYGKTNESRIADPADPGRIFTWLICESYDDKGNVIAYRYKPENSDKVDLSQANERNRTDITRSANRYLKHVYYGNQTPYFPDLSAENSPVLPADWHFELVFDYGEHDLKDPLPQETQSQFWNRRADPFSSYRSTFEVRTYRLCGRALMFHHFEDEANVGLNCLVRSTDFTHAQSMVPPPDPTKPFYSYLLSVTQTGYVRNPLGGYFSHSLPPLQFEYTEAEIDETVQDVDSESLKNLPYGIDGNKYRWVDLDGEGVSGILTEQGEGWFYKPNFSPANIQTQNGVETTLPRLGPTQLVARQPSIAALSRGRQQLVSLDNDGQLDLVEYEEPTPGYYERAEEGGWEPFIPFESLPVLDWKNPNLKFIDLTGDGFPDLLISEDDVFWWHASLAKAGFGPAQRVQKALDEEQGPKLVFYDSTETIFLADMSGDGLTDIVRIRNGEVCYWPNLGYGRFGTKVTMDQAPWFESSDLFDGRRIRLADIDGSGTADIIYFASGGVHLYFNQSGNAWGSRRVLNSYPPVESVSAAMALDLLGNGTACLVWSSPLPGNARQPMRYIDLMGGEKPHLLVKAINNLGAETRVKYAPSTKFYIEDKLAGTPWLTRIPFPVHVVERTETYDYISRNLFATRYAYHHGYYDGVEREFRGFGRVDQWDTEELATLAGSSSFPQPTNIDAASNVPPVLTMTWFHTGALFEEGRVSRHFEDEYYREGDASEAIAGLSDAELEAMLLPDTVFPTTVRLPDGTSIPYQFSPEELREASRSLRGSILRQEIYALDGTEASDRPYSASERDYTIEVLQPQGINRYAVFFTHARESIDYHYERKLYKVANGTLVDPSAAPPNAKTAADPRVTHALTLAVDVFGNVLQSVSIGYGRRYLDPALISEDQTKQITSLYAYNESTFTNSISSDDAYRAPLPAEASGFELIQVSPKPLASGPQPDITNLFRFDDLLSQVQAAGDGQHELPYEDINPTGLNSGEPYRRLIKRMRAYYRPDDMGASAGDPKTLLPLGTLESLALPGESYKLAFTPGLLSQVYQRASTALLTAPASVLGGTGPDGGGYVDLDGHWWVPSGRIFYSPNASDNPTQELVNAQLHFFLPRRFEDPFSNATSVDYDDPHDLLVVKTIDAVTNTVTANNDYRVLQPALVTDPNGNQTKVLFDVLGMPVATAILGKSGELGDNLGNVNADPMQTDIDTFYGAVDPHTVAPGLLGDATTRIVYDVNRFYSSRAANPTDATQWVPAFSSTLARETHVSATPATGLKIQISFSYSDGFGREIQKKIQAEPGPIVDGGPTVDPRWVGSGWTIYNNKGKPVRQYEPFFSQLPVKGHQFEFGVQVGVSPILCYDPVERVVATIHPNQTYEKVVFDPWRQATWDVNDTVLQTDPTTDPDVGGFFQQLPAADYSPTWYAQRIGKPPSDPDHDAAVKAGAHANTPTVAHFDTLGRAFLTIADNATDKFPSRVELDIENNQRSVRDAVVQNGDVLGRIVMRYDYDMLNNRIHQASMEAGERWTLNDVLGKPIRAWDSRGHNFRTEYDVLRRPNGLYVLGTDPANSDPRTTSEVLFEKTVYGEGQASDQALNLRTRVFQHFDNAGVVTSLGRNTVTNQDEAYDFKGNLLRSSRTVADDYKKLYDWAVDTVQPSWETFSSSATYDALNRPVSATTHDGSVVRPTYNEANFLERVDINLRGATAAAPYVTNIDYNAKGQRTLIEYGNSARTDYAYDTETFRLIGLHTTRPTGLNGIAATLFKDTSVVQDLNYTYDPVGNITRIRDAALPTLTYNNEQIDPLSDFTYDAIYRLRSAKGREHIGQTAFAPDPPGKNLRDYPFMGLASPNDLRALRNYTDQYDYDEVGNIKAMAHVATNGAWTRTYKYNEASLLEPGKTGNRLSNTQIGSGPLQPYAYDAHGDMTAMPHLPTMEWDFKGQLQATSQQVVADGTPETTYYVYDSSGQRARKVTEGQAAAGQVPNKAKERVYLGGFEIYREYDSSGTETLERQTLHVMDDKRGVALVETKTIDQGKPVASPTPISRYQFDNHLGSACLELDDAASVISYEEYYPYGSTSYQAVNSASEVSAKRYRYTGKERDEESGLYYHGARYYGPWLGIWVSCDPAGLLDGNNLFTYVSSNPVRLVDHSGLQGTVAPQKSPEDKSVKPPLRFFVESAAFEKTVEENLRRLSKEKTPTTAREKSHDVDIITEEHDRAVVDIMNAAIDAAAEKARGKGIKISEYELLRSALFDIVVPYRSRNSQTSQNLALRDVDHYLVGRIQEWRRELPWAAEPPGPTQDPITVAAGVIAAANYDEKKRESFRRNPEPDKPNAKSSVDKNESPGSAPGGRFWAWLGGEHLLARDKPDQLADPRSLKINYKDVISARMQLKELQRNTNPDASRAKVMVFHNPPVWVPPYFPHQRNFLPDYR